MSVVPLLSELAQKAGLALPRGLVGVRGAAHSQWGPALHADPMTGVPLGASRAPPQHVEWGLEVEAASLPSLPPLEPRRKSISLLNKTA